MVMHTGPVGQPLAVPSSRGYPPDNSRIRADSRDTFAWATVVTPEPLSIVFDGQTAPVPGVPSTCVPPSALLPYTRVWVQRHSPDDGHSAGRRNIVLGLSNGGNPWVQCALADGIQPRSGNDIYHPSVKLDGSGLVDLRGQIDESGLTSMSDNTILFTVPDGYLPAYEVRWIGFPTSHPSTPFGGWILQAGSSAQLGGDGDCILRFDSANPNMPPDEHFSIIAQPWEPVPAQPY